jgi:hypothetical protein
VNNILDDQDRETIRFQVAEKIGWRNTEYGVTGLLVGHPPGLKIIRVVPSYVIDIKAAWEIVDYLVASHLQVQINTEYPGQHVRTYRVTIGDGKKVLGNAANPKIALAICRAFLETRLQTDTASTRIVNVGDKL